MSLLDKPTLPPALLAGRRCQHCQRRMFTTKQFCRRCCWTWAHHDD